MLNFKKGISKSCFFFHCCLYLIFYGEFRYIIELQHTDGHTKTHRHTDAHKHTKRNRQKDTQMAIEIYMQTSQQANKIFANYFSACESNGRLIVNIKMFA